ncbi:putative Ran binding domain, PH-like domain superfamily [Helianthus anomalus]
MASNDPEYREEEAAAAEDEDTGAQVAPIVKVEEVAVTTGEEEEDAIRDLKAKLYRFDKDGNQWKERGASSVKFLKHKKTNKVRLVMRQSKALKICANHLVISSMSVQEHSDLLQLRIAKKFMETFQEVAESQKRQGRE